MAMPFLRPWFAFVSGAVALALPLVACGNADNDPSQGSGASGNDGGYGEVGANGGDVDGAENAPDHQVLVTCANPTCATGHVRRPDGGQGGWIGDMDCALQAMRDRTPGAYDVSLLSEYGQGAHAREHRLVVTEGGEVEVGIVVRDVDDPGVQVSKAFLPTQRCSLKPAAFFDDCLAAMPASNEVTPSQAALDCIYPAVDAPLAWLESCADLSPTCE